MRVLHILYVIHTRYYELLNYSHFFQYSHYQKNVSKIERKKYLTSVNKEIFQLFIFFSSKSSQPDGTCECLPLVMMAKMTCCERRKKNIKSYKTNKTFEFGL